MYKKIDDTAENNFVVAIVVVPLVDVVEPIVQLLLPNQ